MHTAVYLASTFATLAVIVIGVTALVDYLVDYFLDRDDFEAAYLLSMLCAVGGFIAWAIANAWLGDLCGMPR